MNVRAGGPEEAIVPKILKKQAKLGKKCTFRANFILKSEIFGQNLP